MRAAAHVHVCRQERETQVHNANVSMLWEMKWLVLLPSFPLTGYCPYLMLNMVTRLQTAGQTEQFINLGVCLKPKG